MTLLDLITGPWAILPAQLLEMQAIYAAHARGEKADFQAIEDRLGRQLANEPQEYVVREGGVAVFALQGIMAPKANLMMKVSGGTSTNLARGQIQAMKVDHRVRSVVLAIDSPGGSVLGTPALAEAVLALAAEKPTVAVSEGLMASAAYWVASAANAVYIEGTTDTVGSIGVVANHSYEPRAGRIDTEITAGRYKRLAAPGKPLSAEGEAYLQQQVDHIYSVFVDAVAAHRGRSTEQVLAGMADGRVFIGQQAIDAGLVDGISTVEAMVKRLATNPEAFRKRGAGARLAPGPARPLTAALASHPLLTLAPPPPALAPAPPAGTPFADQSRAEQCEGAKRWAQMKGITFVQACKALGIK